MNLHSPFSAPVRPSPERPLPERPLAEAQASTYADQVIQAGSSSFAAAARLFDEDTRRSTVMLYTWCRHCDDVIDGQQLGHGQRDGRREDGLAQLHALEEATRRACEGRPDDHPVFIGLADVVRRHGLDPELPLEHLRGFGMDVLGTRYRTLDDTLLYCYRVAGVVGLMMAHVMGNHETLTLDRACDLGIAFQLTNIARDIVEDAEIGRIYVPGDWLAEAGIAPESLTDPAHREALARIAARLVEAADPYYASALGGIGALPLRSAWSVATARDVYRAIGRKVRAMGSHAWDARVSTSSIDKLWYVARGAAVALATRGWPVETRPRHLWQRPH